MGPNWNWKYWGQGVAIALALSFVTSLILLWMFGETTYGWWARAIVGFAIGWFIPTGFMHYRLENEHNPHTTETKWWEER